jgi:hypothetical protein
MEGWLGPSADTSACPLARTVASSRLVDPLPNGRVRSAGPNPRTLSFLPRPDFLAIDLTYWRAIVPLSRPSPLYGQWHSFLHQPRQVTAPWLANVGVAFGRHEDVLGPASDHRLASPESVCEDVAQGATTQCCPNRPLGPNTAETTLLAKIGEQGD